MTAFAKELRACLAEAEGEVPPPPADDGALTRVTPPAPARAPAARVPPRRARRSRRRPAAVYVLLALAVAGAALAAVLLLSDAARHHVALGGGGGGSGATVHLRGIAGYDPQGDGQEHNELAALATDGSTSTSWTTETYGSEQFGGLKDGVGLMLDAGSLVKLAHLTVTTPTPGFTAEIQSGDSSTGGFATDSSSQTVDGTTTFTLEGKTARYYVVWITQLPPGNHAEISEVKGTS